MAIFRLEIRSVKRSTGQQATGAAAYRAGENIRDERTGDVHNHSRRKDVRHSEIVLPSKLDASNATWAQDRARLWNTAEAAEKRRDSRVAREYQVALPPELTPEQRVALARSFSRELADRYGVAVDLAIHDPKPGRESTNFHAHLLTTTREVTPTGLGAKTGLDMHGVVRAQRGLSSHSEEYSTLRERWATLTNHALHEANVEARVDHRSLAAQGLERKPLLHIPLEFYQLERKGMPKEAAERLREDYRTRLSAFRERSASPKSAETAAEFVSAAGAATEGTTTATASSAAPTAATATASSAAPTAATATASSAAPTAATATASSAVPTAAIATASSAAATSAAASGTGLSGTPREVPRAAAPSASLENVAAKASHTPTVTATPSPSAAPAVAPTAASSATAGTAPAVAPRNSEEIRRRAVQAWLRMRSKEAESTNTPSNEAAVSRSTEEGRDR